MSGSCVPSLHPSPPGEGVAVRRVRKLRDSNRVGELSPSPTSAGFRLRRSRVHTSPPQPCLPPTGSGAHAPGFGGYSIPTVLYITVDATTSAALLPITTRCPLSIPQSDTLTTIAFLYITPPSSTVMTATSRLSVIARPM